MKKVYTFQNKFYLAEEWKETMFGEIRVSEYYPKNLFFKKKNTRSYVKPIFHAYLLALDIEPKDFEEFMTLTVKDYLNLLEHKPPFTEN